MLKKLFLTCFFLAAAFIYAEAQTIGTCTDPNMELTILRCVKSGDKCHIDGKIENIGPKDITYYIGGYIYTTTALYDDMGNKYVVSNVWIGNMNDKAYSGVFPSQVPLKIRFEVNDVSEIATKFVRFEWILKPLGDDDLSGVFKVVNIPIGNEGSKTVSNVSTTPTTTIGEDVQEIVNSVNEIVNLFKRKK